MARFKDYDNKQNMLLPVSLFENHPQQLCEIGRLIARHGNPVPGKRAVHRDFG